MFFRKVTKQNKQHNQIWGDHCNMQADFLKLVYKIIEN